MEDQAESMNNFLECLPATLPFFLIYVILGRNMITRDTAVLISIILSANIAIVGSHQNSSRTKKGFIKFPPDYNKSGAPIPDDSNELLIIRIGLDVWTITDISAEKMDMEVDLYVRFWWPDHRVIVNKTAMDENTSFPIGREADGLWKPLVHFRNCKGCLPIDLDPRRYTIFYINKDEVFSTVVRTLMRFTCDIDLRSYPMDRQNCNVQLENYFEDTSEVVFHNMNTENEDNVKSKQALSEFLIENVVNRDCSLPLEQGKSYACLEVSIMLVRQLGHHLMTMYAPTTFIVLVSWISFWIPADAAPARITLGVTSLLTLATRLDQAQKNLPPVSYVKAVDIWLFACIFLVFASLVEFAVAYYWLRRIKRRSVEVKLVPSLKASPQNDSLPDLNITQVPAKSHEGTIVDRISQAIFPLGFIIFNICYWSTYLSNY